MTDNKKVHTTIASKARKSKVGIILRFQLVVILNRKKNLW